MFVIIRDAQCKIFIPNSRLCSPTNKKMYNNILTLHWKRSLESFLLFFYYCKSNVTMSSKWITILSCSQSKHCVPKIWIVYRRPAKQKKKKITEMKFISSSFIKSMETSIMLTSRTQTKKKSAYCLLNDGTRGSKTFNKNKFMR